MSGPSFTPIVIGVGDFINRSKQIEDAVEPLQLMLAAINVAFEDTGLTSSSVDSLRASVDSLDVVRTWTWPYHDLPGLIAEHLGTLPKRREYSEHGGNQPGLLFDEAARRISKGESKVAILTGGEALASCKHVNHFFHDYRNYSYSRQLWFQAVGFWTLTLCCSGFVRLEKPTSTTRLDGTQRIREQCFLTYYT